MTIDIFSQNIVGYESVWEIKLKYGWERRDARPCVSTIIII